MITFTAGFALTQAVPGRHVSVDVLLGGKELQGDSNVGGKLVELHHSDEWLCVRLRPACGCRMKQTTENDACSPGKQAGTVTEVVTVRLSFTPNATVTLVSPAKPS